MFADHFNLPNEMAVEGIDENGELVQVKTTFRGQNNGTSQSHGNYIQATADEIANHDSMILQSAARWRQKEIIIIFMIMYFL